jgi:predicted porin
MQKKILTAAVAAAFLAPAAVMAQSTVVLYGLVDVGYQNVSKYQATATNKSGFGNGGARSSRLGARATEDLGGGLSARAVIEFDITGDTGQEGGNGMTGRQTFVSLDSKSWGELSLGRQLTHSFGNVAMAEGIAGANSFQSFYQMEDQITRASNYLKYSSPLIGGGFTFGVGMAPGEDTTAGNKGNRNYLDMHARWEQGPFGIGLAHARFKNNTTGAGVAGSTQCTVPTTAAALAALVATGGICTTPSSVGLFPVGAQAAGMDNSEKDTSLAGYYKFSGFRIYAVHSRSTTSGTVVGAAGAGAGSSGGAERFRLNGIRGEMDIGKGILALSFAQRKAKHLVDSDSNFWGIGYYHQMTTRTQFYATYARVKNETGGGQTLNGAWTGSAVGAGFDPRGLQIGMGHSF